VRRATLIPPNIPEAESLLGRRIAGIDDMEGAARDLLALGCGAVLLKGGHLPGDHLVDLLAMPDAVRRFADTRIHTDSTHGTGCTLASAVAAGIAQGMGLPDAVSRARAYVRRAIETAPGLGHGHGPLNHLHAIAEYGW